MGSERAGRVGWPIAPREGDVGSLGEVEVGETSHLLETVVENNRRSGLDPDAFLQDILTRLPKLRHRELPTITPAAWSKAQKPAPSRNVRYSA
jgi:hypothetical protein